MEATCERFARLSSINRETFSKLRHKERIMESIADAPCSVNDEGEKSKFVFEGKELVYVKDNNGMVWIRMTEIANILFSAHGGMICVPGGNSTCLNVGSDGGVDNQQFSVFLNQNGIIDLAFTASKIASDRRDVFLKWLDEEAVPGISGENVQPVIVHSDTPITAPTRIMESIADVPSGENEK